MDMAAKYNGNRGTESALGTRVAGANASCEHASGIGQPRVVAVRAMPTLTCWHHSVVKNHRPNHRPCLARRAC